jgi:BirA family biotin operon repressor/biotin-[acetyl-CoA-carboxylase] ligase
MDPNLLFQSLIQADSTNNYATQQIREGLALHGNAWFTSHQTDGKGQRGKRWESENGKNLAISIALQHSNQLNDSHFVFNMFIANTCASFFEGLLGQEISIKWPNDLFINDRKAGGILIENVIRGKVWQWSVVGIGLNLNQTSFSPSAGRPLSLTQLTGKYYDPELTAREVHSYLMTSLPNFLNANVEAVLNAYNNRLYRKQEMVSFKKADEVFLGKILGVNAQGFLMVETGGVQNTIQFGEVEWLFT